MFLSSINCLAFWWKEACLSHFIFLWSFPNYFLPLLLQSTNSKRDREREREECFQSFPSRSQSQSVRWKVWRWRCSGSMVDRVLLSIRMGRGRLNSEKLSNGKQKPRFYGDKWSKSLERSPFLVHQIYYMILSLQLRQPRAWTYSKNIWYIYLFNCLWEESFKQLKICQIFFFITKLKMMIWQ